MLLEGKGICVGCYTSSKHPSPPFLSVCFLNQNITSVTYCYSSQNHWVYSFIFIFLILTPRSQSIQLSCPDLLCCTYFLIYFSSLHLFPPILFQYYKSQHGTLPKVEQTSLNWSHGIYFLFLLIHSLTAINRLNFFYCNQIMLYLSFKQSVDSNCSFNKVRKPWHGFRVSV